MAVSDGQILMFIAVLVAAWYLLGSETCSGCVDECRAMGSSKAACQDKCAKKGVCSFASIKPLCKDCMADCSKNLGSTYDACKKACEAKDCEGSIASQVVVPSQPIAPPSPPKSMGMALRGAGPMDDDKSWY